MQYFSLHQIISFIKIYHRVELFFEDYSIHPKNCSPIAILEAVFSRYNILSANTISGKQYAYSAFSRGEPQWNIEFGRANQEVPLVKRDWFCVPYSSNSQSHTGLRPLLELDLFGEARVLWSIKNIFKIDKQTKIDEKAICKWLPHDITLNISLISTIFLSICIKNF